MNRFREAHAVVGMHYGDEGKGRVVKSIIKRGIMSGAAIDLVIKHNGGSQAGHTVVSDEGVRHVHSQLGAGTFFGVPTYLAPTFYFNPAYLKREIEEVVAKVDGERGRPPMGQGFRPMVFVDVDCQVTWLADVLVNQHKERARGSERHGSCGHGIFETFNRVRNGITSSVSTVTMGDQGIAYSPSRDNWNRVVDWHVKRNPDMDEDEFRLRASLDWHEATDALEWLVARRYVEFVSGVPSWAQRVVFESAQGLGLDMDNTSEFPHLTP